MLYVSVSRQPEVRYTLFVIKVAWIQIRRTEQETAVLFSVDPQMSQCVGADFERALLGIVPFSVHALSTAAFHKGTD